MFKPFLIPLSLCLLLVSCEKKEQAPPAYPPMDVTAYKVEPRTLPIVFDYVGFAESYHPVEIRARVEGYLDEIAYEEGRLVEKGDLLFQLDPKQFEAKVAQANGEVARQEALVENAKLTVNRLKPLYEQKAASKKDLDNALSNLQSSQAALVSAKAQQLEAEINLGYTTITSPIAGIADKSKYRQGALISPGAGSLMTTVSVLDPIWVYFTISDNDITRTRQLINKNSITLPHDNETFTLSKQNEYVVDAILSDGSVYPEKGKVNFSSPTYDQSTGTILARAEFPNPIGELRPGQFIHIKVHGIERPDAIFVPRRALMQKNNGMFVYLIDENHKVVAQDVGVGDWYEDYQIITNGLKSGDQVIVDGINKVRPQMTVNVTGNWKPEPTPTAAQASR